MAPRVVVFHASNGCDTGCCGHIVAMEDNESDDNNYTEFVFDHPNGYPKREPDIDFAKRVTAEVYGAEHVKDLDWENSTVYFD